MRRKKKLKPDGGGGRFPGRPPRSWPVLASFYFQFPSRARACFLGRSDFLAGQKVRPSGLDIF